MQITKTEQDATKLQHDVQHLLAWLDGPMVPIYYRDGIIDAGAGYYQLAKSDANDRVLLYALNLEDLQRKLPSDGRGRPMLAKPDKLFAVAAYGEEVATAHDIYCDLVKHQADLKRDIREEYTAVRDAEQHYRSRAISYGRFADPNDATRYRVHAFVDALHGSTYADVYRPDSARRYNRIRHPRLLLTTTSTVSGPETVKLVLDNFSSNIDDLADGRDNIQHEDQFLSKTDRRKLRLKIYAARFVHGLKVAFDKNLETYKKLITEEGPTGWFGIIERIVAARIFLSPGEWIKNSFELVKSLAEVLNVTEVVHRDIKHLPEALQPYVEPPKYNSKLARNLRKLNPEHGAKLIPLSAEESALCPDDHSLRSLDPFKCEREDEPRLSAIRVALGTIVHRYGDSRALLLQANGIWMALDKQKNDDGRIYVGYNRELDTNRDPHPTPLICAHLRTGKILRFTRHGRHEDYALISQPDALAALSNVITADDHYLLRADQPPHAHRPHMIPKTPEITAKAAISHIAPPTP